MTMSSIDECPDVFEASHDFLSDHREHKTMRGKCWSGIVPRSFLRSRVLTARSSCFIWTRMGLMRIARKMDGYTSSLMGQVFGFDSAVVKGKESHRAIVQDRENVSGTARDS
jgi:hypothetical protein